MTFLVVEKKKISFYMIGKESDQRFLRLGWGGPGVKNNQTLPSLSLHIYIYKIYIYIYVSVKTVL
jgi:hypothetical protein